ncbi:MAG: ATP-binding protein [Pseudomonadota bacterium]|nr:ATP-binding protein [Pseudomonadota bacterium]
MATPLPAEAPVPTADPIKRNRSEGIVVECNGTEAKITTKAGAIEATDDYWAVGQLISIQVGKNRVVGLLHRVENDDDTWDANKQNTITLHVELSGEVRPDTHRGFVFSGGITQYPYIGAIAHKIRKQDLVTIYKSSDPSAITIGALSQAPDIPAVISVDSLFSRHFAVVGTTGTGKSTAVTLILHLIAKHKLNQRILSLDPHNEYTSAFGNKANTITADTLDLPFWLLNLEEFQQVVFRGREGSQEEIDALREFIPKAKTLYRYGAQKGVRRKGGPGATFTADTPVPYRFADLMKLMDEEIGSLDGAMRRLTLRQLRGRLEAVVNDPRFSFMFGSHDATDRIEDVLGNIYRVPLDNMPITVFQMSGIPSEVVNSVASVLCRLAFDIALASQSKVKTLVVCEEAHRYIPSDVNSAFAPTRAAIARIAKEGRKYGVSLAIITQRPNELDPTILSQCNTIFSLRLGNDADQDVMRKAIASGSRSTLAFLSSLADRECIAFGSAVSTPMRMRFRNLAASARPSSQNVSDSENIQAAAQTSLGEIVFNLRGAAAERDEQDDDDEWTINSEALAGSFPEPEQVDLSHELSLKRRSLLRRKTD